MKTPLPETREVPHKKYLLAVLLYRLYKGSHFFSFLRCYRKELEIMHIFFSIDQIMKHELMNSAKYRNSYNGSFVISSTIYRFKQNNVHLSPRYSDYRDMR